jgi:hypothetical protein
MAGDPRTGPSTADDVEEKAVELSEVKAGLTLKAGHRVRLVVNGAHGSRRKNGSNGDGSPDAKDLPPGTPGGIADGAFVIELQLHAAGGTPLAHERIRIHDPDTGEPVGAPGVTNEKGVLRARVPAEKHYHLMVVNDAGEEHELPERGDALGGHERSPDEHAVLSVKLLDAARAPLKAEKVHVKGDQGAEFDVVTDDDGCFHELAEPGVYDLAVRGSSFKAHTVFHGDREGTAVPYQFIVR